MSYCMDANISLFYMVICGILGLIVGGLICGVLGYWLSDRKCEYVEEESEVEE